MLDTVERQTGPQPQWSVLWLHGLGADGHDFAPIVPDLVRADWPALRFVFPHAPVRAVTINGGARMRAWYDIRSFDRDELDHRADAQGVDESVRQVEALIAREGERGIPPQRVLLAGFSQGGAITLAAGVRRAVPLAGLIGLSTYLPGGAQAAAQLGAGANTQPLFMAHGLQDPVVPCIAGETSAARMRAMGFEVEWHRYPMPHSVCAQEVADLAAWMSRRFAAR
ncbi:alpha/beta hydrolase [Dyella sp.]|uniref:alpha/beta hydrolase n=1 Tax=Dyella sp. TaxID=1869338 RepID=UPI002D78014F|nr:alpha/beta hydrolase [Dyella sp.]HET6430881.1 alpha/beta hydrolase [Dyella sp.]